MMLRNIAVLTITVLVFCANTVWAEDIDIDKILAACSGTVIINGDKVSTSGYAGGRESSISFNGVGAGIIVDPRGYIITNYHVIEGIQKIQVKTYDGTEYRGQLISYNLATDIALIKITPVEPLVPILIGDSSKLRQLMRVVVTGHPFGYSFSTNSGEISGLYREVPVKDNLKYYNMIQISAGINPGNSGGPLLTILGEMIGLNSALRQDANQIAFAIPVDFVMEVGANLFHQHTSQSCYHGIRFKEIDVNMIGTPNINVDDYKILAIDSIEPDSPAEKARLLPGDILLQANDLNLERKLDLQRSLIDKKDGDTISVVFDRDGTQYKTDMVLQGPKSRIAARSANGNANAANTLTSRIVNPPANQSTGNRQQVASLPPSRSDSPTGDYVWNKFGIRVNPVTHEEFQRRTMGMNSPYVFEGAVEVLEVKPDGIFASLRMQKGDMLAAIITPADPWNITRVSDLKYLADRWTSEEMGGDEVVVIVVRNKTLLKGPVSVHPNNLANMSRSTALK
jgi:serine protease Do